MTKKSISSLELAALINEMQFLVKGKVSQIYHQDEKEFLLQLHAPGQGKKLLKVFPGKFLCLIDMKDDTPSRPSGFCMALRKYLSNAFIAAIYQKDAERIVVFELEKKEKYCLIFELFSKGNIVLVDENYMIIACLQWQRWKDRVVKPKVVYAFSQQGVNWKSVSQKELEDIFSKSEKRNLATSLATEIGLGGVYAEEVCLRAGLDKDIVPSSLDEKGAEKIHNVLKEFSALVENPQGHIYEEEITPFALQDKLVVEETTTYNEAISRLNPYEKTSPYEKKIKAIEKTIATQEEAIVELGEKVIQNTRRGELIYEKYALLQKLLDIVNEMRKEHDWDKIEAALRKEKKIRSVDLKKKSVVIEL